MSGQAKLKPTLKLKLELKKLPRHLARQQKPEAMMHKRKRRRKPGLKLEGKMTTLVLLMGVMGKLLCDTHLATAAMFHLQDTLGEGGLGEHQQGVAQRLIGETEDVVALQGQSAQLACLVESKQGKVSWARNGMTLVYQDQVLPSYLKRVHLPEQAPGSTGTGVVANYSLQLHSVTLRDDGLYQCKVSPGGGRGRQLESRQARLAVLVPPTQLQLLHASWPAADREPQHPVLKPAADGEQIETNAAMSPSETHTTVVARQGARLRLVCRSDPAKPQAELAWLDQENHKVRPNNSSQQLSSGDDDATVASANSEAELKQAEMAHTFTVQRHHHRQQFTCQADHQAFRQPTWPHLFERKLRRQVQLDVWHEPEIELILDPRQVIEHQPILFQCLVQANPMHDLRYVWFIDGEPVANASDSELRIARATRQLHQREIRCQVTNSVGSSSASHKLQVRYGPQFVGHLLPTSPSLESSLNSLQASSKGSTSNSNNNNWPLSAAELQLARQLALTFQEGQDLPIQCQFDANPRAYSVNWFRTSTNFSTMRDVQPHEADELIAFGYARATFREPRLLSQSPQQIRHRRLCTNSNSGLDQLQSEETSIHIVSNQGEDSKHDPLNTLDYEQMSREIESELEEFRQSQQADSIPSEQPSTQLVQLEEPISWQVKKAGDVLMSSSDAELGGLVQSAQNSQAANLSILSSSSTNNLPSQLQRRETNVTNSQILLISAREESVGRYICQARSPPNLAGDLPTQSPSFQRAIQVVMRRKGRLVSTQEQLTHFGSQKLKVECLAQLSNQLEQGFSQIQWLKNGEPIEGKCREGRSLSVLEERSPDLLFLRSTLIIELAQELSPNAGSFAKLDFGHYNCTLLNGQGQIDDFLAINLREPQLTTGYAVAVMGSLAVGSLALIAFLAALLIVCPARGRLGKKLREVAANEQQQLATGKLEVERKLSQQLPKEVKASDFLDHHSTRPHQNQDNFSAKGANHLDVNNNNDDEQSCDLQSQKQQQAYTVELSKAPQPVYGPLMATGNEPPPLAHGQQQPHKLRSSLRNPTGHYHRGSANFAAIHESLEHTLQLPTSKTAGDLGKAPSGPSGQQEVALECDAGQTAPLAASFVDRLLNRLSGRPAHQVAGRARHLKPRPQISGPMQSQHLASGGGSRSALLRRSSLSTSLSMLGQGSEQHGSEAAAARIKSTTGGHHLVSSSANLIQDSTTASDGTASSSRSSSSQGQNQDQSNGVGGGHQQTSAITLASEHQHHMNGYLSSMYAAAVQHQQQTSGQWQPSDTIDCSLYVNHDLSSNSAAYLNQSLQSEEALAVNGYCVASHQQLPAYSLAYQNQGAWQDQKQATSSHYQLPMQNQDPYYLAQQRQQQPQPCYSTICTANKPSYPPPPLPLPLPPSSTANGNSNATPYGTLPMRPSSRLSGPHLMVPSSDAADAFYETNYGTLCRSSAIKTMGYVTTTTAVAAHSTASSSPNSLTTHNSNNNSYHPQSDTNQTQMESDYQHHNIIVQSDGSCTTTTTTATSNKILNDNGQATHV